MDKNLKIIEFMLVLHDKSLRNSQADIQQSSYDHLKIQLTAPFPHLKNDPA
jgi:hypothetical protein